MFNQKPYNVKVGIYLPKIHLYHTNHSFLYHKNEALYQECCIKVVDYFTFHFGGCTRIEAIGSYQAEHTDDPAYNIHEELIYAFIPKEKLKEKELYDLCRDCCRVLKQNSIAIEVNNKMYFICC
jgi:hypothetical protein